MFDEDAFGHYGIKGMKWGIRRDNPSGGKAKRPEASKLSDDELKKTVARMNLEKQYSELVDSEKKRNRSSIAKGGEAVADMITTAGKNAIQNELNKGAKSVVTVAYVIGSSAVKKGVGK